MMLGTGTLTNSQRCNDLPSQAPSLRQGNVEKSRQRRSLALPERLAQTCRRRFA